MLLGLSPSFVSLRRDITRAFVSYGDTKCLEIRMHYHFQVIFSPDNRAIRNRFHDALAQAFSLDGDVFSLDSPDEEFLISILDKPQYYQTVQFLQSDQRLSLGSIHFTTLPADEAIPYCSTPSYDSHDNYAGSQVLIEIRNLPLHLWTFKTTYFMLHPYYVVSELYPDTMADKDLSVF